MSSEREAHSSGQAAREARSRLARVLRNGRGDQEVEGRGTERRNWSEQATESMAVLRGLNTVGALVTFLFLVFMFASAKGSKQRLQQQYPNYPVPPAYQVSQSVPLNDRPPWNGQQWNPAATQPNGVAPPQHLNPAGQAQPWAVPSIAQQQQHAQAAFAQPERWQPGGQAEPASAPQQPGQGECCPCTEHGPKRGRRGGDNLATAAGTLGGMMWAGSHIPQGLSVWKSRDTSSFSFLSLLLQAGAAVLVFIFAAVEQNVLLALFGVWNGACYGFYVWMYVKHPPGTSSLGGGGSAERGGLMYSEHEDSIDDDGL